jgi:hypothetical protein
MKRLTKYCLLLLVALLLAPVAMASSVHDDDDKDPSIRPGIRRLHPERERAKAIKKLMEQRSRKADPNADPWDTSDEVWGTVDLPPVTVKDGNAVEGQRLTPIMRTSKTPAEQAAIDSLLAEDYSIKEYGYRRMSWRDLPVTKTLEQLTPGFTMDEDGDCYSRYVTRDNSSNELYFVFKMGEDSLPGPLRLCVQYCADDPLDFDQLIFTIDGYDYPFYPSTTEHGIIGEDLYWERSDDVLQPVHKDLVYALAHSNWVALKLLSTRGIHHVKMLTDGQRSDLANTLDLYRLLGGTL